MRLLERIGTAQDVVSAVTTADAGRDHRQLHVMDSQGRTAGYTGNACIGWCGHVTRDNISMAGNMLVGPMVIEDTAAAYAHNDALSFPRRLIAAMRAGEAAGGDKRGKQSAALVICGDDEWPNLNLRVDDHGDPLAELERLEKVSRQYFVHFQRFLPGRHDHVGVIDRAIIEAEVAKAVAAEVSS
jgi:uncharacterized Ntn-hydrolase superfamily protein